MGANLPEWFDVSPKTVWDMMHNWAHCCDEAANHQLPITAAFWIIWIVSAEERWSLMQNLMQIRCFTHSVILNVTAPEYTCLLNGFFHTHWLVQWSHHRSRIRVPVHSLWLPGYIVITQTVLVMLTMAGLFPDRSRIYICIYVYMYIYTHIYTHYVDIYPCTHV